MRVVHVYKDYDPPVHGGIEKHIATLGRFLVMRGIEVEVLCSRPSGSRSDDTDGGVRIRRCTPLATLASTPLPPALPYALATSSADVIHLHHPWPPGEAAWWLASRRRPLVISAHCEAVRYPRLARLVAPLSNRAFAAARRIVVAGEPLRSLPLLADHGERVEVVPYGIDLERFSPSSGGEDPLPGIPRPRVLFVGRLRHYKGLATLAAALARLPNAQLIVVGEGAERAAFEADLRTAGVRHRTHFQGSVGEDRLIALLRDADAAVLSSTSRAEAFGLAIAEAQACGAPAVTTDVGTATPSTIADGRSGRVVPPGDADALAAGLSWCLSPDGRRERRAAARAHAESRFSAGAMAEAMAAIYAEIG